LNSYICDVRVGVLKIVIIVASMCKSTKAWTLKIKC